jgi:molecular chaperone Hsp33
MENYMVRALARSGNIRALACDTTRLVDDARRLHGTFPTASAALGRALTGGILMGALLKTRQRVALKFEGNGPLKKIIVEAENNGTVRGFVEVPHVDLPLKGDKLDVAGALGRAGFLTVTKDLGLKEPYSGMVQLYTSEIAEDLAFYLTESEQIPSAVGLGVFVEPDGSVSAAGGFLVQSFPPADEKLIDGLIERIEKMPSITELLRGGKTPEGVLDVIFGQIPFEVLERRVPVFHCSCNRERIERVLISLGREEIAALVAEQGNTDVTCEFCRKTYHFDREELERLLAMMARG